MPVPFFGTQTIVAFVTVNLTLAEYRHTDSIQATIYSSDLRVTMPQVHNDMPTGRQ